MGHVVGCFGVLGMVVLEQSGDRKVVILVETMQRASSEVRSSISS
jgi:ribosomal 30S subunit maturation factor RimM